MVEMTSFPLSVGVGGADGLSKWSCFGTDKTKTKGQES